jgi:hypothetical protein
MDLGRSEVVADRRLRLANSSPDVKALFNSPAYIYNLEEQDDNDSYVSGTASDYWTPLAPIVCPSLSLLMDYALNDEKGFWHSQSHETD